MQFIKCACVCVSGSKHHSAETCCWDFLCTALRLELHPNEHFNWAVMHTCHQVDRAWHNTFIFSSVNKAELASVARQSRLESIYEMYKLDRSCTDITSRKLPQSTWICQDGRQVVSVYDKRASSAGYKNLQWAPWWSVLVELLHITSSD